MAKRYWRKLAILHKIEATYATSANPAAADALIGKNVSYTPLEAEEIDRDLLLPYFGHQGIILAGEYGRLEFEVEMSGAGGAGDVPKYGSMLRIAGLSETVSAGVKVDYEIIEEDVESGTLHFMMDGVRHVLLGGRANVTFQITPKNIPVFRFSYMGLLGTITDEALPVVSRAGWTEPVKVSKANTVMTLHGWTAVAENLTLDLGNTVTPRFLIGDEGMEITGRKSSGTAVVEARLMAEIDWFARARARTRGALSLVHGTQAGNIVEITAPAVEIGKPALGQTDGIANYSLPLVPCPTTGLDELMITVR